MSTVREESAIPNARKFMQQVIRGSKYTFSTALADIIDNSIEANANNVWINVDLERLDVSICDDGKGMSESSHAESMKIAAETRDYDDDDLGKYGTGMKAASLSQARKLTVATRTATSKLISVRRIDMDHIEKTNDWSRLTLVMDETVLPAEVLSILERHSGTAVIWQDLDRIFVKNTLKATAAREELRKQLSLAEEHLAMTFHRFLDGKVNGRPVFNIFINGVRVEGWDPFLIKQGLKTRSEPAAEYKISNSKITMAGYILPGQKEFPSDQAFKKAGGPGKWVNSQGFWVYRNNRLIRGGGWLKMRSPDPHMSLARIAVDFPSALDTVFSVDVSKSYIELPLAVKKEFDAYVTEIIKIAKKRYGSQSSLALANPAGLVKPDAPKRHVQRKLSAKSLADLLLQVSKATGLQEEMKKLKLALQEQSREIADEIGWLDE